MQFLRSNLVRTILIVFIVFLAVPFLFTDGKLQADTQPMVDGSSSSPVIVSKNPLSKFLNRVAGFYGFKKNKGQSLADKLQNSYDRQQAAREIAKAGGKDIESGALDADKSADGSYITASAGAAGAYKNSIGNAGKEEFVQEYVRMNGKTYDVVTDMQGRKFVAMEDGMVSFDELMNSTVSKEEFEAAQRLAPHLSEQELIEAIRSPGGVQGYLSRGGNNMFSNGDTPSAFGKDGGKQGNSSLFGLGGGMGASGGDDSFNENKTRLSEKYNRVNNSAAGSAGSLSMKYTAANAMNPETYVDAKTAAGLGITDRFIGANPKKFSALVTKSESSFEDSQNNSKNGAPEAITVALNSADTAIIPDNKKTLSFMTDTLLNGKKFEGTVDISGHKQVLENPWTVPNNIDNGSPAKSFYGSNVNTLSQTEKGNIYRLLATWEASDNVYNGSQKTIIKTMNEMKKPMNIVMIDGFEKGNVAAVRPDTFFYQVATGLFGNRVRNLAEKDNTINLDKLTQNKTNTIVVVPTEEGAKQLRKNGFNVVVFNQYAVTPEILNNFYADTLSVVEDIKKRPMVNPDQQRRVSEISNSLATRGNITPKGA